MQSKPAIAIVGAGNLANALAFSLRAAGYPIEAVIGRSSSPSRTRARTLAKEVGARGLAELPSDLKARVVWFCVPDGEIRNAAHGAASKIEWTGRVALHSSGALTSDELSMMRKRGAAVASVHPLMTFVRGSRPSLTGVSFAIEGDRDAMRVARGIVRNLGGRAYPIQKKDKAAYHAWATFASPLLTALLATAEQVAARAAVAQEQARARMIPILRQTLENYANFGAASGFSGPIIRGDIDTVKRHLRVLRKLPYAREVYQSLASAAVEKLPGKNKRALRSALKSSGRGR